MLYNQCHLQMSRELIVVAIKGITFTRAMSSNVYAFCFDVPGSANGDLDKVA